MVMTEDIETETEVNDSTTATTTTAVIAVVAGSAIPGSGSEVAMVKTSSASTNANANKKKNRSASVAGSTKSVATSAAATVPLSGAGAGDKVQPVRRPPASNTATATATAASTSSPSYASNSGIATLTFANRSRSSSMASVSSTGGGGGGGAATKKKLDLLSSAALADPIQELFESRETVPASELYRDKARCRPIKAGSSSPPDLTPLAQHSSDDENEEEEEEDASLSATTPSKSKSQPCKGSHSFRKYSASTFSPSIEMKASGAGVGPPPGSSAAILKEHGANISTVQDPQGAVRLRDSSASGADEADGVPQSQTTGSPSQRGSASNSRRGSASSVKEGEGGVTNTSGYYDSQAQNSAVSADDFLPMFTFVLVQANLPHLLITKELMTTLVDDEETYGECGYYLATLEAALKHVADMAADFKSSSFSGAGVLTSGGGGAVRSRGSSMGSTTVEVPVVGCGLTEFPSTTTYSGTK